MEARSGCKWKPAQHNQLKLMRLRPRRKSFSDAATTTTATFSHMKIMTKCAAAAAATSHRHRHRHRIIATIIAAIVMNFVIISICIFMFGIGRKSMWQDHVPRTAFHVRSESCSTAPAQVGAALGPARAWHGRSRSGNALADDDAKLMTIWRN